jgi:hypothetical protein
MADNNYRTYRSRDPVLPRSADAQAWAPQDDPLAELARLIGQSDPTNDTGRDGVHGPTPAHDYVAPADGADWAADDHYAGQSELTEDNYDPRYEGRQDERYDEPYEARRDPPPLADPLPQYRAAPPVQSRDYGLPATAPAPRLNGARGGAPSYAVAPPRYRDEQAAPESFDRQLPAFPQRARDDRYEYDDQESADADAQYALEDYEEEAPGGRRRGGLVVVAAVLGLAVLGTAGAFAYRAMFGGSMLPSLPPIIRADDGPTKIMPNAGNAQASNSDQANANSGSDDKLVPRQETPVVMPQPPSTAPRVVSTIPIFPDPTPGPPSGMTPGAAPTSVAPWPSAPMNALPPSTSVPLAQRIPPNQPQVSNPEMSTTAAPAPSGVPGARVIHTVPIRPDEMGGPDTAAAPPSPSAQAAPAPRPVAQHPVRPAPAPEARADANAPLSIVPTQGNQASGAPARMPAPGRQTTLASIGTAAPAAAGGGYAVQVSSQRSEVDAQTEFRVLQAKFPNQLGGHRPMVRRADLGDKGVYYRALVGPFASMEQAAQMCSSLKAAGGNCIVQKD